MIPLEKIQNLYDQNRFLEAFRQTADYWKNPPNLKRLSVDELILGARLAQKLGGRRLSRWLFRKVSERDPSNPRVRYFAHGARRRRHSLLDHLRELQANPNLDTDDPELKSSWLAWNALLWASLRDFTRAHDGIERARDVYSKDGWVASCESGVLGMADRWEEALKAAESSWELSSQAPFAAHSLANSLLNLGRIQEAADRLGSAAENCESFEIVYLASWHHAALADTREGEERKIAADRARGFAEKLPDLAPLADRESRSLFARVRLDLAELSDDHEQMEHWAKEIRSPFYHKVLLNLRKNPSGSRIRLPFRREMQKHLTCLPTSLASALAAMNGHIDADLMAAEVTFGGTEPWAAADWLTTRGFVVRFFVVTPELARLLIRNGIAFVLGLEADDFAHAVAIVGLDEAAGTLQVHDPQQFRTTEYLLDSFGHEAPLGPRGMAAVPPEKLSLLDELLPRADVEVMTASQSYYRALQLHGPTVASVFLLELLKKHPSHPGTQLLKATHAAEEGRTGDALAEFQELLKAFPGHSSVRVRLLWASRSLGNTALLRETLESIVERGLLPGVKAQQEWLYPPSVYVCQYADLLRLSAATTDRARVLLLSVIRHEAACAEAWHVLADLAWHERDFDAALLSYRLASCLAENNEHYAHAYAEALGIRGHLDEGLGWLEERVRRFGASARAIGTWITWISGLEVSGRPEEALHASNQALQKHGSSPELLAFVAPFFARMGQWDQAESFLDRLESAGNAALFHEAAVDFHSMKGELDESIRHAEAWVRESPLFLRARSVLLDQIATRDGAHAALERARRWLSEQPGHDGLEELCCAQLDRAIEPPWRKALSLRRRLKRNSEDAWAWRELASRYLFAYELVSEKRRERFHPVIIELLAQSDRTAPGDPATLRAKAMWSEARGERQEAVAYWLESIDRDPGTPHGYRRAWECSATFDVEERRKVWQRIEGLLLSYPGRLQAAREVTQLIAERSGFAAAEVEVSRWKEIRPDDPEITEALSDLLLDHGHGRSDAERALAMLQPAVERFPFHLALRFSLLNAYRKLGKLVEAEDVVREIIRRHPASSAGRIQLAWIHELAGRGDEARQLLEEAIPRDPQNAELPNALVEIHIRNGRLDAARSLLRETMERLPKSVAWRERSIHLFLKCGDEEQAVNVAREGVQVFPRGAYFWYLLGDTLDGFRQFAAPGEVEGCLRRSLELNQSLFDTADRLALVLVGNKRYEEAEEVVRGVEMRLSDPCPARGRLAWIHREQGQKKEAVEEMVSVLRAAPWYQWGWSVVIEWLVEDQDWDKARSLLGTTPPEIRTYPQLLRERLRLLEMAGFGQKELDEEWSHLLSDFSEDVALHLDRYDSLHGAKRLPEGATVLRTIHALEPDNPFVCARLVEVLAREHKNDDAIDVLLRVFFAPVEQSAWPADYAWERARGARFAEEAFQKVKRSLEEGARPTPHALTLWASFALERASSIVQLPQPLWRRWFPDSGAREVLRLVNMPERFPWMDVRYRARVFAALTDFGYEGLVIRYWRKHRTEVERDPDLWAQTCRALTGLHRKREARELLATWSERPGVDMWTVANYVNCFSSLLPKHLEAVRSACAQALRGLPHDHSARYLAHVQAEACALLGDTEGFLEIWNEHRGYFDGEFDENEWFHDRRMHLLTDIPTMVSFLEQNERWAYWKSLWRLRLENAWRELFSSSLVQGMKRIHVVIWWLLFLGILAFWANL